MRKGTILIVFLGLGIVLFILTLDKVGFHTVREALAAFSFFQLSLILFTMLLGFIFSGTLRWKAIMRSVDADLPNFWKLALVKTIGFSLSYITPAALLGGEPARFFVLKGDDEDKNSRLVASIVLDKIIQILSSFVFFFAGLFLFLVYLDLGWSIEIIIGIMLSACVLGFWILIRRLRKVSQEKGIFVSLAEKLYLKKLINSKKFETGLSEVENHAKRFFIGRKDIIPKVVFYSILEVIFVLLSFWLIIFFMGHCLTLPQSLVIKSMTDLAMIIPLPAALGTLEATQAFVLTSFNLGPATGVALSLVYRGLCLVIVFFGILLFAFSHFRTYLKQFVAKTAKIIQLIFKNEEK